MKLPNDYISWIKANPKLVDVKPTSNPDLFVLKYKRKVFYDGLWNRFLEDCRGTIVDKDWNIVSLPFRKVYNYGIEKEAPRLRGDTLVSVYRKVNGFMVAASMYKGELLLSTTGSIDSSFAKLAWEHMNDNPDFKDAVISAATDLNATLLFECCDKSDPHIIAEEEGLHYLGYRVNNLSKGMDHMWDFGPNCQIMSIDELQRLVKVVEHEGFVFYTKEGVSGKIKSPHYLVKKLFMRGRDMETLIARNAKQKIDEEYYPLLEHLSANREKFDVLDEQGRRLFIEEYLKDNYGRKD